MDFSEVMDFTAFADFDKLASFAESTKKRQTHGEKIVLMERKDRAHRKGSSCPLTSPHL